MTALKVIGIILLIFILIGFLRVGALMQFGDELRVQLSVGPFRFTLLPAKEKKETPKKKAKKVTFRSTKSSIVSVNKKGKCKAKKAGKAKVIVSCGKKKKVISVTVTKKLKKVKKVTLSKKSASLFCGSSLKLTAKLTPAKTTKKGVVYRSSKSSVASVSKKGVVMAKKKGTAVITAYAKDGRGAKAVCKITVKEKSAVTKAPAVHTSKAQPTKDPLITEQKAGYFTIAAKDYH